MYNFSNPSNYKIFRIILQCNDFTYTYKIYQLSFMYDIHVKKMKNVWLYITCWYVSQIACVAWGCSRTTWDPSWWCLWRLWLSSLSFPGYTTLFCWSEVVIQRITGSRTWWASPTLSSWKWLPVAPGVETSSQPGW